MSVQTHKGKGPLFLRSRHDPNSKLDYHFLFTSDITISTVATPISDGVYTVIEHQLMSNVTVKGVIYPQAIRVRLQGGTAGARGMITVRYTMTNGQQDDRSVIILCQEQ